MKHLTRAEWQYLEIGEGADRVTRAEADQLLALAETAAPDLGGSEPVLTDGRHRLRLGQTVGILVTPSVTLEILPKIDTETPRVRRNLIHMIAAALDLPLAATDTGFLDTQNRDVLEILIARFARDLLAALRRGLPRLYQPLEEELPALRGRLNVERQFSLRAGRADLLICRHDELSADTPLARVLKAAAVLLSRLTRVLATGRALAEALLHLEGVAPLTGPPPALTFDRSNTGFRQLYSTACLFLRARFQTTSAGRAEGLALLFRMNLLFEAWFARDLRRTLAPLGWQVRSQSGRLPALWRGAEGVFRMIPDLVVEGHGRRFILDTKWKRLGPVSDPKRGVAQADVYQLMAYQQAWGADAVALIYPGQGAPDVLTIGATGVPFLLAEIPVHDLSEAPGAELALMRALTA